VLKWIEEHYGVVLDLLESRGKILSMNKRYCFNQNEIENIINRFGKDFYEKVLRDIEVYAGSIE
jgi:hypothetical protein